jgi:DNA-binding CsgD family transcriptional regulator
MKALKNKHFSINTAKQVLEIGASFLKEFKQAFFGYDRVYDDGTCFRLSTNTELLNYLYEHKNMITAPIPHELIDKDKFTFIVPDQVEIIKPAFLEFKKKFKVNGVVNFIEKKLGYYDQFWFNSYDDFSNSANTYINNMESIQKFHLLFKDKASDLIRKADQDRFKLDPGTLSNLKGLVTKELSLLTDLEGKDLAKIRSVSDNFVPIRFSKREKECIAFILLGLTSSEIASHLRLSVRTVEYYIDNVKNKIGCTRKLEIATYAIQSKLSSFYKHEFEEIMQAYLLSKRQCV